MRLEIEPTVSAPPLTDELHAEDTVAAEFKSMLTQGIKAAQSGNRPLARMSLQRATEIDPTNESAWLWLASISEYPEELLGFLNHVLAINPANQRATEWKVATHALLAKTFVQRGIDAVEENQKDFAAECFETALQYDTNNATAYLWLASLSDSNVGKIGLLERSLECDPTNESAMSALEAARANIVKDRLTEAKTAAVAGDNAKANSILDDLISVNPNAIDAWTLKSHLAEGFDEKIRCFENILAIDPDNIAARAGRDSLLSIFGTMEAAETASVDVQEVEFVEIVGENEPVETVDLPIEKSPTQDLEMPEGFSEPAHQTAEESHLAAPPSQPEEENVTYPIQASAEPHASYETEAPQPAAYDVEPVTAFETESYPHAAEAPDETSVASPSGYETVAFSYDEAREFQPVEDDEPSSPSTEFFIPMPESELPQTETESAAVTTVERVETLEVKAESFECMFCNAANEPQSITCNSCMAVLTLSDLELLLANQNADKLILRQAVEDMERQRSSREFHGDELVVLGIGHLNLRNLQLGYSCLVEASKIQPDNVVLSGQVNSLLIRLDEIRQQEEAQLRMPKGKSILVVDDSPTVRKLIAGKLEKSGHDVVCANDGVEAMERLEGMVPDLILLDITMPRMDGYQVCKNIRSKSSTKDVPVVMISGKDGFFDKVRGRMAGTTGYITKPFGPETLMKAVEMYLSGEAPDLDEEV
jgi:twitching motility two-component system response regulator PilG